MKTFTSTLLPVIQQAWGIKDLDQAKNVVLEHVRMSRINDSAKNQIQVTVTSIVSKPKFDYYLANSLLKYEGLGVGQLDQQ
jgi:hypothetical protein